MFLKFSMTTKVIFFLSCVLYANSFSLSTDNFKLLVKDRCFNQSTTLGQYRPSGLTVENLISSIERAELQNPDMKPQEILQYFLERFVLSVYFLSFRI